MSSPPSGNPVSAPVGGRPVGGGGMSCAAPGPALALDATVYVCLYVPTYVLTSACICMQVSCPLSYSFTLPSLHQDRIRNIEPSRLWVFLNDHPTAILLYQFEWDDLS